ncbi:MAG: MmgE/PrpD family protein, partial [Armatimonadota bacterium]|nr:MmgE/PrpD family protein [Armatimonadota bacterium]
MTATDRIAAFVHELSVATLSPTVIAVARRCLQDTLGCILGGAGTEPGRYAAALAREMGGAPEATLVLSQSRLPAPLTAFAHATMANALDFDDTLFGHPGATVVPTVLALGEAVGADGSALLAALVAGYEVSARVVACARPLIPRYTAMWDLGTLQTYGAAAAAAKLLALPPQKVNAALGLAGATAPVPLGRKDRALAEQGRSMVKSAYGWTVHSAILAARLAQRGFTGPAQIFDGTMGFWEMGAAATPRIAHLTDRLGETYLLEEVQFKPYPACRFLHPVLDGIRNLLAIGVRGEAVRGVEVRGFSLLQDEYHNISRPRSPTDAQFSVPYTVAVMLLDGRLGPDAFTPERLTDSRTLALADRVRVTVDPDFEAAYPQQLGA